MRDQGLTIEKLTPHIGAEVLGVDLSRPLDEPTFKQVEVRIRPVHPSIPLDRAKADRQDAFS